MLVNIFLIFPPKGKKKDESPILKQSKIALNFKFFFFMTDCLTKYGAAYVLFLFMYT